MEAQLPKTETKGLDETDMNNERELIVLVESKLHPKIRQFIKYKGMPSSWSALVGILHLYDSVELYADCQDGAEAVDNKLVETTIVSQNNWADEVAEKVMDKMQAVLKISQSIKGPNHQGQQPSHAQVPGSLKGQLHRPIPRCHGVQGYVSSQCYASKREQQRWGSFCHYHGMFGHFTEDCAKLKREICVWKWGSVREPVKDFIAH